MQVSPTHNMPMDSGPSVRAGKAAEDFEALLLAQMLRSARETSSGGWSGSQEDESSNSILELAEQQIAQALASAGGLGLSSLISQGLETKPVRSSDAS